MSKKNDQIKNAKKSGSSELMNTAIDLSQDYAELTLDTLFDNEVLKEIPVIKTIISVFKIGTSIKERHFAKKLLIFLKEFQSSKISDEKLEEFKNKFNSDILYKEEIMQHIAVFNDRFIEEDKSRILANLFASYVDDQIDWNIYIELAVCLERLFPRCLIILKELAKTDFLLKDGDELDSPDVHAILAASGITSQKIGLKYYYGGSLGHDLFVFGKI